MEGIQTLKGSWPWPWPSIGPYGISSCISHRPLPIYQISFKLKKLFVDGWTYVRTDGRTDISPLYIIRSTLVSRPKNKKLECWLHTTLCKCAVAQNQLQTSQECWAACTCREPAAGQREVLASMHMQRTSCRPVGSAGWRARAVMMQVLITIFVTWLSKNINVNICYYDCHKVHRKRTGHACILKAAINFQQQRKTMSPFTAHIPLQPR